MTAKFSIWIFKRSVRKCILQFCFEPARKYFSNTFSAATEDQVVLSRMFLSETRELPRRSLALG